MLDGDKYLEDTDYDFHYNRQRQLFQDNYNNPRDYLFEKIRILGLINRPKPMVSTTTNN